MTVLAPSTDPRNLDALERGAMRALLADLFPARPVRYWLDFLASAMLGWAGFALAATLPLASPAFWLALAASALALYRAVSFTHELAHLRRDAVPGFRTAWTLLCGMPLLVPNFLYTGVHVAHHGQRTYGTARDGEYLPFATRPPQLIVQHLLSNLVLPGFALARFALIGPLSFLHPHLRRWVVVNLSGMSLRFPFRRDPPARAEEARQWLREELATSVLVLAMLAGMIAGWLPLRLLLLYALLVLLIATLNSVRAVGATHRYRSPGRESTLHQQLEDSVSVASGRLDALLLCPVGLRYHALHHAFPTLPYHALGEGHRRLLQHLAADHPYRATLLRSVWQGWRELLHDSRRHQAGA